MIVLAVLLPACRSAPGPTPPPLPGGSSRPPSTSVGTATPGNGGFTGVGTSRPSLAPKFRDRIATPRPGRYTYDVEETAPDAAGTPRTRRYAQTATIDAPIARDNGFSVEIRTTKANTDEVTGEVFLFHQRGIDLLFADGCVLDHAAEHYRFPLAVGARWPSARSCEGVTDGGSSTVPARRTIVVGGVDVDAFAIRRTASFDGVNAIKTQWFSPAYQIVVRSELSDTVNGGAHSVVQTLRALTPA